LLVTERTTFSALLQEVMASKGATEWSKVLDVDRTTVHKWWSGDAFPRGRQLEAIARETGRQLRFVADDEEAAPPKWAERLADETASKIIAALAPDDLMKAAALLIARLEALPPPHGDSSPDSGAAPDPGASERPAPGDESPRG
jgi:hypothetical protein